MDQTTPSNDATGGYSDGYSVYKTSINNLTYYTKSVAERDLADSALRLANCYLANYPSLQDWRFEIDFSNYEISWLGMCAHEIKILYLSHRLVLSKKTSDEHLVDCILHEITHALLEYDIEKEGDEHGPIWRKLALENGVSWPHVAKYVPITICEPRVVGLDPRSIDWTDVGGWT